MKEGGGESNAKGWENQGRDCESEGTRVNKLPPIRPRRENPAGPAEGNQVCFGQSIQRVHKIDNHKSARHLNGRFRSLLTGFFVVDLQEKANEDVEYLLFLCHTDFSITNAVFDPGLV